MHLFAV